MACIAVRLWCPHNVSLNRIIHVINESLLTMNIPPPFTDALQTLVDNSFPASDRMEAHCFRLNFPRGPIVSTEPLRIVRRSNVYDNPYGGIINNSRNSLRQNVSHTLLEGLLNNSALRSSSLEMLEFVHTGSARGDTIIRDIDPDSIMAETIHMNRNLAFRRLRTPAPAPRRAITVPSHVCSQPVTCAICLNETERGEVVCTLPCCHTFHKKCLTPWLMQGKTTCPTCRRDLSGDHE